MIVLRTLIIGGVVLGLGVAVFFAIRAEDRETNGDNDPPTAESVRARIEALLDSAQRGEVDRHLGCFAEPLRSKRREQLGDKAEKALRAAERHLNGFVIVRNDINAAGARAEVVLEKIYPEHEERWQLSLQRNGRDWLITRMQALKKSAPATKFGTPVVPELPTGQKPRQ